MTEEQIKKILAQLEDHEKRIRDMEGKEQKNTNIALSENKQKIISKLLIRDKIQKGKRSILVYKKPPNKI